MLCVLCMGCTVPGVFLYVRRSWDAGTLCVSVLRVWTLVSSRLCVLVRVCPDCRAWFMPLCEYLCVWLLCGYVWGHVL